VLSFEEVEVIVNSELDHRIVSAREMSRKLRLHVDGIGLQDYLERINNYENEAQFLAREKHAISNKFITEELLRPVDNAFHARGGSRNYKFKTSGKEDELVDKLVDVKANASLSEYIEQEWFHRFVTDPNGLIFMEIKESEEEGETVREELREEPDTVIEPTYKSIFSIRAYEQNGIFVDWVIFEPHVLIPDAKEPDKEEKTKKLFWAVDNKFYYLYEQSDEGLKLINEIENSFDKVPAILCSNIHNNVTGWKKSPIDAQIELLDKYLVSNSVLNISEFFHNYPIPWRYVDECNTCHGSGTTVSQAAQNRGSEISCTSCGGTGKATKDVTDGIDLKFPANNDDPQIDPPAGYITTPTEAWTNQITSLDRGWDIMYFSQWGTTVSKDTENETATGRFLDAQPVNNRLNKYSKSIEQAHTAIANFIGQFYFPETFEIAIIQYGRRYLIETPDQIWEKYLKSKNDDAPTSTLDLLLFQYYESEFRENERLFIYESKKARLEPFVHWDVKLVKDLAINQTDYYKKVYFSEWIHRNEVTYIIDTDLEKLDEELTTFATEKIPKQTETDKE
jgi:hypothetical protein